MAATERRVAELVASGQSNKEAAAALFVTVRAIESTLTKVYAKLGVRSRTELAALLRDRAADRSPAADLSPARSSQPARWFNRLACWSKQCGFPRSRRAGIS